MGLMAAREFWGAWGTDLKMTQLQKSNFLEARGREGKAGRGQILVQQPGPCTCDCPGLQPEGYAH